MATAASLLVRHFAPLYGYVFAALGNHEDTEDVLQEVSLVVAAKFGVLDREENFLPWAREIARRTLANFRRSAARRPAPVGDDVLRGLAAAADDLDRDTDWSGRHAALVGCLEALPAESRRVIRMRYDGTVAGVDELARAVGRTTAATYGLLKRIREALRECVERKLAGVR